MREDRRVRIFRWGKRAGFSLGFLLLLLLGIEGSVRLFLPRLEAEEVEKRVPGYSRWNDGYVLHYIYHPVYNFRLAPRPLRLRNKKIIWLNALGLKGPLPKPEKAPGTVRVVVLGGSATFQFSRWTGQSWPDLLAERLVARTGQTFEVINAATPGYTAYQSSRRLESELLAYKPDLILVCHLWNDIKLFSLADPQSVIREWEALAPREGVFSAMGERNWLARISRSSQTLLHLRFWLLARRFERARLFQEGRVHESLDNTICPEGVAFYRANLERIISAASAEDIPVVIIEEPTLVRPDNSEGERERIQYRYVGFDHATLVEAYRRGWEINAELCRKHSQVFCLAAHTALPGMRDFFSDQVHLTGRGREALAEFVADELVAQFGDFGEFLTPRSAGDGNSLK